MHLLLFAYIKWLTHFSAAVTQLTSGTMFYMYHRPVTVFTRLGKIFGLIPKTTPKFSNWVRKPKNSDDPRKGLWLKEVFWARDLHPMELKLVNTLPQGIPWHHAKSHFSPFQEVNFILSPYTMLVKHTISLITIKGNFNGEVLCLCCER